MLLLVNEVHDFLDGSLLLDVFSPLLLHAVLIHSVHGVGVASDRLLLQSDDGFVELVGHYLLDRPVDLVFEDGVILHLLLLFEIP